MIVKKMSNTELANEYRRLPVSKGEDQNNADDLRMHLLAAFELQKKLRKAGYFIHPYIPSGKTRINFGGGLPSHARVFRNVEEDL